MCLRRALSALCLTLGVLTSAFAQNYPLRPVRLITGDAGGTADITSRMIARGLAGYLGQQVIVDNRAGGGGAIAAQMVTKAPPDGYTLVLYSSALWIGPLLEDMPWDPVKDFAPVILVASAPTVLVVHPSVPVKSVRELIALAKARPGALNYASGGLGGAPHLAGELFKAKAGVNFVRVTYKGSGSAVADLLSGYVQLTFGSAASVAHYVKSQRVKALAVTSAQPSALTPDLPTIAASGVPGYVAVGYYPMFVAAGTPVNLINRLNQETLRVINMPEMKQQFLAAGVEPVGGTPGELASVLASEIAMWGKLFSDAGIRK